MWALLLAMQTLTAIRSDDPFAFFQPAIAITAADRRQLDRGEPIARIVHSQDGEVAVFAAVRVEIDGDRLVAWTRRIEELKKSPYVAAIGRFSDPPRIEDLASLALDDDELPDLRTCQPGKCGLKLSAGEMSQLRRTADEAGSEWRPALQLAFRQVILQRVKTYLAGGHAALPPYDDRRDLATAAASFASILDHSVFLSDRLPRFAEYLRRYPRAAMPDIESFVYWSKERLAGKAIARVTHVSMLRSADPGVPDALVAGKEIFATHYLNASLGLTAILRQPGAPTYLAYLNRSDIDVLDGALGGLVRWGVERRVKREAADVLRGLRLRLESGEPKNTS